MHAATPGVAPPDVRCKSSVQFRPAVTPPSTGNTTPVIQPESASSARITQALGLEPSLVGQVGEHRGAGTVWDQALWGYNGFPGDIPKSWASLEDGLTFVLDRLEPLRSEIDKYKQKYDAVWWCGHFQSSFDGGPTLSAKLMRRLADFGVDLYIMLRQSCSSFQRQRK